MKKAGIVGKIFFLLGILIALVIGNVLIGSKLNDRERERNCAVNSISYAAGGEFDIKDISICIPWSKEVTSKNTQGYPVTYTETGLKTIQADSIFYKATLDSQKRTLGIYSAPIFTGEISFDCDFDVAVMEVEDYNYKLNEAYVRLRVSDKSVVEKPVFNINGKEYNTVYTISDDKSGITAQFPCKNGKVRVTSTMKIRGARNFQINLSSSSTQLNVISDWPSPGFSDYSFLPSDYEITDDGFTANWNIPFDSGNGNHSIGFEYIQPVDVYKMLDRSINYGFLFIIVPFIVLILFEIFASINLHPVNYLLSGAASVLFFLLLLSTSEHINFLAAYLISSAASGILVSAYIGSVTKKFKFGFGMSFVFIFLYGYLYFSLQSEDYSLLIGSILAFVILAVIMFFTRKIDWYNLKNKNLKTKSESDLIEV